MMHANASAEMVTAKRQAARKVNTALLQEHGIAFQAVKGGLHLVINDRGRTFDAWPSSGKWRQRDRSSTPGDFAVHKTGLRSGTGFLGLLAAINDGRAKK